MNYTKINLKGFMVGNPETDDVYDLKGLLEYAWSHAVISDEQYNRAKQSCDFKASGWSNDCHNATHLVYQKYKEIDIYNIYAPICLLNHTSSSSSSSQISHANYKVENNGMKSARIFSGGYDPCYSNYAEEYFNRADVQQSLHANTNRGTVKWNACNNSILNQYNYRVRSVLSIYKKLVQGGIKVCMYRYMVNYLSHTP
ncbi:hypothetical protein Cgig2_026057 [Carnegiea gigantea]|uniref:Uncharacterized protein n=1 Tax=Carnegiea gigantea TaxID=171969 RepID=A0A9Q1KLB5_9CARY|nr:hypothetical protein Cgig2_026057 [Carnegiea gigantea]